ncbi:hypothetical protein Dimus_014166 [Dionaea muscipula]
MVKAELVFVPMRGMGHITPMVELAKRLAQRHPTISVNICVFDTSMFENNTYIKSLDDNPYFVSKRIRFIELHPELENSVNTTFQGFQGTQRMLESYKPILKQVVEDQIVLSDSAGRLAGFVLDFFATQIMDVAEELNVPAYIFYASNCSLLSLTLHFQHLRDDLGVVVTEFAGLETELDDVPGFRNPVPCKVLPGRLLEKEGGSDTMLYHAKRYRSAKGILVNTFEEVESYGLRCLSDDPDIPSIYLVGPVINVDAQIKESSTSGSSPGGEKDPIISWLDDQPPESVVFLCFGTWGIFDDDDQVMEIAKALERSGHRFLWALRRPASADDEKGRPLPDGFLERTANRGKIIGWAPQVTILSHPAVGAFVTHCGWNSTLESLWFGVPMAAWPMYAEQQMNAFRLVRELGLAVEIRMDYRSAHDPLMKKKSSGLVAAEVIENGIRKAMDIDSGFRRKFKDMSLACREAGKEGGSSYNGLGRFIDDVFDGIGK